MLTRIKLTIDSQPGTLTRVIGGVERSGFILENHRVARSSRTDQYEVGLSLQGEPLPLIEMEAYLGTIDGVVRVDKLSSRSHGNIDQQSSEPPQTSRQAAFSSDNVLHNLLSDALVQQTAVAWAETADKNHVTSLVDHLVAAYPQTATAVVKIENAWRGHDDRNVLVRSLGVRVGRRVCAMDHRSSNIDELGLLLDRMVAGYMFPFARCTVMNTQLQQRLFRELSRHPWRVVVNESAFAYRRGKTLKIGARRDPCVFLEGFIEGVIDHSDSSASIAVEEKSCIARGAQTCVFICRTKV